MKNYKSFPDEFIKKIESHLARSKQPQFAAFDADGTLWDTDIGENFFKWQIDNCNLPQLKKLADPMSFYKDLKRQGKLREAYLFLAAINKGYRYSEIQTWAKNALQKIHPLPIFPAQMALIELLQGYNVEVYVVTASVKWSVEPAAALFNIPASHVLGVKTEIHKDLITDICEGEVTFKKGKHLELLNHTKGIRPFLCCGNTTGDLELLEIATDFAIAVGTKQQDKELAESEQKLHTEALKRNWTVHQF